ncbi:MAG: hypothetical protein OEV93_03735 [Candidatus Moranbacteria bacterium]|nr:hypothetical protein [Candidatus Moranbacteria bacterium]
MKMHEYIKSGCPVCGDITLGLLSRVDFLNSETLSMRRHCGCGEIIFIMQPLNVLTALECHNAVSEKRRQMERVVAQICEGVKVTQVFKKRSHQSYFGESDEKERLVELSLTELRRFMSSELIADPFLLNQDYVKNFMLDRIGEMEGRMVESLNGDKSLRISGGFVLCIRDSLLKLSKAPMRPDQDDIGACLTADSNSW